MKFADGNRIIDAGEYGKYRIVGAGSKGGLNFPEARRKFGDRMASSMQT